MGDEPTAGPQTRSVLVLYASETGNAQEVAEELGDLTERLHFVTQVSEMNLFKPVGIAFPEGVFWGVEGGVQLQLTEWER